MKEFFKGKRFRDDTLALIEVCNRILDDYAQQGFDLSLRQLYYQLVSKDLIPNSQKSYSRLGDVVSDARLAGLLDWDMIVDRGRGTRSNTHWDSPTQIIKAAVNSFRIDKWEDQPCHIEVMVEKQALEGVIVPTCRELDVNFTANKGYSSQSFMYRKGQVLKWKAKAGKEIVILYLGDHDPSGLDMDRDVLERLTMFSGLRNWNVDLTRLALTMDQIDEHKPPPNPAKVTDSRAHKYINLHGRVSWELDALDPATLAALVEDAVAEHRDEALWKAACAREDKMKEDLVKIAEEYEEKLKK
jgi:hypothetical protein